MPSTEVVEVRVELPKEVVERILRVLPVCTVLRARAVCRYGVGQERVTARLTRPHLT